MYVQSGDGLLIADINVHTGGRGSKFCHFGKCILNEVYSSSTSVSI